MSIKMLNGALLLSISVIFLSTKSCDAYPVVFCLKLLYFLLFVNFEYIYVEVSYNNDIYFPK